MRSFAFVSVVFWAGCGGGPGADGPGTSDAGAPDAPMGCQVLCGLEASCCEANQECNVGRCVPRCEFNRCGQNDEVCCGTGEVCVADECTDIGGACSDFRDCDASSVCDPVVGRCVPVAEETSCRFVPPVGEFSPQIEWEHAGPNMRATPIVAQLTDDNGDGVVNTADTPDIVVPGSDRIDGENGRLIALRGDTGEVIWQFPDPSDPEPMFAVRTDVPPAAADVDGDGSIEIFANVASTEHLLPTDLIALNRDGTIKWHAPGSVSPALHAIAIGDLEGDGFAEIVAGGTIVNHDGSVRLRSPLPADVFGMSMLADVDDDGDLEIIQTGGAIHHDGTVLWTPETFIDGGANGAIAHVTRDRDASLPELVLVGTRELMVLDARTGEFVFGPVHYEDPEDIPVFAISGPPTIADFDGDGRAEIGVAAAARYIVFDLDLPPPHIAWSVKSQDVTTGSAGSAVFDFDADGSVEVVTLSECELQIRRGSDGELLWSTMHTSETYIEYPVVADVDGDGNGELIVVGHAFRDVQDVCGDRGISELTNTPGLRVYGDRLDNWVPARAIWNQHTYHITNINADGTVPRVPEKSWTTHNSYRLNTTPSLFAPDLAVGSVEADTRACPAQLIVRARIENRGAWGVAAGLPVAVYSRAADSGETALLGVGFTQTPLLSGDSAWIEVTVANAFENETHLTYFVRADDDGSGVGIHSECHEDNNESAPVSLMCRPFI